MIPLSQDEMDRLPIPQDGSPLRVLLSGCLAGRPCGIDGTSYGVWPFLKFLQTHPYVQIVAFCPEDWAFGTPRELCNIHGGNGFDVLAGRARVLTEVGEDWTQPMLAAAETMLQKAREHDVHLAILMDISAACGSQVIYDGHRTTPEVRYQQGPGVCAALLRQHGIPVISQRDHRILEQIHLKLDASHVPNPSAIDHHETAWYRDYFKV
ncbi:MAG TPA: DUF523 domain-containing protein [Oligoflexus sp.]|uniref:DUF523 domain-containing protein n=1 Tax=Oligoflexus sp. TaxID=1971216 RepID=UPI002D6F3D93|nr:DUF523 domain-containing protein [Oligoflexus sp.]HYX34428.1 DUF523 domain-containing protein [Oligoflexus sp.]